MERVGEVVRTAQGLAIARVDSGEQPPGIGAMVVDESLSEVGRIVDVFGPVDQPYVAVTPHDSVTLASMLDTKLYAR